MYNVHLYLELWYSNIKTLLTMICISLEKTMLLSTVQSSRKNYKLMNCSSHILRTASVAEAYERVFTNYSSKCQV